MSNDLRAVLATFRAAARTEREKGTYFERLAVVFIKNDPGMAQEYEDAWLFADWAREHGIDGRDTGIDAVAKVRGEDTYCAIQCKFYREGYRIQQGDIDAFFTASGRQHFSRRLVIDTTDAPWSSNAEEALNGQQIPANRIGLDRLEESPIDWGAFLLHDKVVVAAKKEPRPHQIEAIGSVVEGFQTSDRGKLILACGTGKTYTALKLSEKFVGIGGMVLFLVPSLALMSQSITEWAIDSEVPLRSFAVCSDAQVGKRRRGDDDLAEIDAHDLDYPATTNAAKLAREVARTTSDRMTVVFATYQSIQVISDAQANHSLPKFDLIICDEAHRTTGAKFPDQDESYFVKVHDQAFLKSEKRLYMTATPRVFGDAVRAKANEASVELCSMDREDQFGPTFFARGFGWAVENGLLTDYKVVVLAVDEAMVSAGVQKRLADAGSELKLDDATKIIGCYKALTKAGLKEDVAGDPEPMHRALAFCRDIASSKLVKAEFEHVVKEYLASEEGKAIEDGRTPLTCDLQHVDGTFGAKARTACLDWLKAPAGEDVCRILTNARCLSEGVDVPALDAILFMHPRKSQIDVVQSVGRVMRRAEGKRMGYVILPIGVPAGMSPEEALNDNERYRVVWQILNALRSHDERLDATINKMDLGVDVSAHIEVIAVSNKLPTKAEKKKSPGIGHGSAADDDERDQSRRETVPVQTEFVFDEFAKAIMAKIVKKCGRRDYWETWAADIAEIAKKHITRITSIVANEGTSERAAFDTFLTEIRDDLNDSITEAEAIEMLAQHVITKPVFEALFEDHSFASSNPVSIAMQSVLDVLDEHTLEKESASLQNFYASVRRRAAGIDSGEAKQRIVVELYDKFFRAAFPRMTEKLGIVYTPIEIVDFIIRSVEEVLRAEFGQGLGSPGLHIIDPFTGTGTFITRLIQLGILSPEELRRKYRGEIHANEIVLLAYYIAAINIEAAYHAQTGDAYESFTGICLTDTFQLYEKDDLVAGMLADNSSRRARQKSLPLKVIIGNPPYSAGQKNQNDNAANIQYPILDRRIRSTFAARSNATNKNALYDSYIRAIRWAGDRLADGGGGVMAFVTNAGWLDADTADGMRKCLAEEFSSLYVFHLRGNQRTQGEASRREGGKVFGSGSRAPIAISVLVKNPNAPSFGNIFFYDVGDYLTREQKLKAVAEFGSLDGIAKSEKWRRIVPNEYGDWINQRAEDFNAFLPIYREDGVAEASVFSMCSNGIKTNSDPWMYNASRLALRESMSEMIDFYNSEIDRYFSAGKPTTIESFVDTDPKKISWHSATLSKAARGVHGHFDEGKMVVGAYRPFQNVWLYNDPVFVQRMARIPSIFPDANSENRVICVIGVPERKGFSVLMSDRVPNLHLLDTGQCFPLWKYRKPQGEAGLFGTESGDDVDDKEYALTDEVLTVFRSTYGAEQITKEDIFYYVYGLLHSEDYRDRYIDNLAKQLPRIPLVRALADFWAFSKAGHGLAEIHVNYESANPYPVGFAEGDLTHRFVDDPVAFYRVEKMRFGGKRGADKTTVVYNSRITMINVPLEAYDYVVNGKPALEWVMDRQGVRTDKDSGIVNDANRYAIETIGDPAYPLKLFQRVITVSLETMKIVRSLPPLDILQPSAASVKAAAAE